MGNTYCAYYFSPIGRIKFSADGSSITGLDFIGRNEGIDKYK